MGAMQCVPFDQAWITSDKLDLHAIYRRPRLDQFKRPILDEQTGVPAWDYTGGLPVRRHNDHLAKGFEYVTLASVEDVGAVAGFLKGKPGVDLAAIIDSYESQGGANMRAFKVQQFLREQGQRDVEAADKIGELVEKHGADAVEDSMRAQNPNFVLPERFRKPKKGKASGAAA